MQAPSESGPTGPHAPKVPPDTPGHPGPVVGIGASAGGLQAVSRFLRELPDDTGCGFVFVQHLDPGRPSALRELLSSATHMPVVDAADGLPVAANTVYVIQPNTRLTFEGHVLRVVPRVSAGPHLPVDQCFSSLAAEYGSRAVGIVLSGNGADGAAGLKAIRDAGGMTFVQDPSLAEFPGMPAAALASGAAEAMLSPEAIATMLVRLARDEDFGRLEGTDPATAAPAGDAEHLRAIYMVMAQATGIDFSLYRETMVLRRVLRRLAARSVPDLDAYARLLADDATERAELQRDLLIGVTSFFRDPEAFEVLKTVVFPVLVRGRGTASPIRIWVAGCATGEEVYSILIALAEFQTSRGIAVPVQMFASDLSEAAVDHARAGRYTVQAVDGVGPERLRRFFTRVGDEYQIVRSLREQCVFSRHNLLDDPPFARLDLVSCRNVLIYLDAVQHRIVPLFHYALLDHGFLMLGRSETTHHTELFVPVDPRQRIYAKRQGVRLPTSAFVRPGGARTGPSPRVAGLPADERQESRDLGREADRIVASRYSPTALLVDGDLRVLDVRGPGAPFLALSAGVPSFHLVKHVSDTGLFLAVERLVGEVTRTDTPGRAESVPWRAGDRSGEISVEATPVSAGRRRACLVLFEATGADARPRPRLPADHPEVRVAQLERELQQLRTRLVSLVDEHTADDEGQQQVTAEALSANEELQSLTEELETAKEELQSSNEELQTLNRELELRNRTLVEARDLARTTIETVGVPLLVVDRAFTVMHANAPFLRAFLVTDAIEGQPLDHLCGGALAAPALRPHLEALQRDRRSFERIPIEAAFPAAGVRSLLVSGSAIASFSQLLLTLEDETDRRTAERALQRSEEQRRQSEKMETVGRLAGGIAHDFNNLLTVIIGNAGFVAEALPAGHAAAEHVVDIVQAAERAGALTDQLLAFSRKKVLQPKVFDLGPLVTEFERMLSRLLPETIRVVVRPADTPCFVRADPAEIGRVIMNLCVNARDAMPAGGTLTLSTGVGTLEAADGLPAGAAVRLSVADTGTGMDADTRDHAFEPFFTTKDASSGAGLGLATVFGIVQQSGGTISVDSAPGKGTRFTILLPAQPAPAPATVAGDGLVRARDGVPEVLMLVEDNDTVRRLTRLVLERVGYTVLEAADGRAALLAMSAHAGVIDLLVSDVMMPEMGGGALAAQAIAQRPGLKVLFVSGHSDDLLVREGLANGAALLQKPYNPTQLTRAVRDVLDGKAPAPRH